MKTLLQWGLVCTLAVFGCSNDDEHTEEPVADNGVPNTVASGQQPAGGGSATGGSATGSTSGGGGSGGGSTGNQPSPPPVVTGFKAQLLAFDKWQLAWDQMAESDDYLLEVSTDGGGTYSQLTTTSANSYLHESLSAGQEYTYRLINRKDGVAAAPAPLAKTMCTPVLINEAILGSTSLTIDASNKHLYETNV